ncbi:MAG: V-type ATP synthase subunit F [Spirochaetes bacterium]|nr:V-type ATP synthase subunit F [Spirochaetota bacterium]MBN2771738.1 V-type ATP synthase subunit F [Spirochaetota bacterium]
MKYFIIGDEDTVLGFGMVGVHGRAATNEQEAQAAFEEALSLSETAIIIITEQASALISGLVNSYTFSHDFPLIVEIPGMDGRDLNKPRLREMVNEAIGINL